MKNIGRGAIRIDSALIGYVVDASMIDVTPEMKLLQAELGARHLFREAARILETFLPCEVPLDL